MPCLSLSAVHHEDKGKKNEELGSKSAGLQSPGQYDLSVSLDSDIRDRLLDVEPAHCRHMLTSCFYKQGKYFSGTSQANCRVRNTSK